MSTITAKRLRFISVPRGMHSIYLECNKDYFEANNFQNETVSKGYASFENGKFKITDKGKEFLKSLKK